MTGRRLSSGRGKKSVYLVLMGLFLLMVGCGDDDDGAEGNGEKNASPARAVVVNGVSSSMAVVEFGMHPQVIDNVGGIGLGPSANRVAVLGQEAYVVNSGTFGAAENASVQVIDLSSASLVRTIPFPDGDSPWDIAIISPSKAYVTNLYGNSIAVLDPRVDGAAAIVGTIDLPTGSAPAGILVVGDRAYTANTAIDPVTYTYGPASVSVIDTTTDSVVDADSDPGNGDDTAVPISGVNPQELSMDVAGNLWVVCTGDWSSSFGVVDVIDTLSLSETESLVTGGSPGSIAVGNRLALVGDGAGATLFLIDVSSRSIVRDATNPWVLTETAWSFVPEILFDRSGNVAFALAFQDDKVFELADVNNGLEVRGVFELAAGSGPAGIALSYD